MIPVLQALCGAAHGPHPGGAEFQALAEAIDATERARGALRVRTENDDDAHRLVGAAIDCDAAEERAYAALRLALAQAYRSRP